MPQASIALIQLVLVVCATAAMGRLARRLRQPAVVGEMAAGLLLGPSFFGYFLPHAFAFCFGSNTLDTLHSLSRLGVWLFIFLVGLELDLGTLGRVGRTAVVTSNLSIAIPFLSGLAIAPALHREFGGADVRFIAFALFVGAAMSITAFPVLARILKERQLSATPLGTLAIACAAVDDVTAWCVLAIMMVLAAPESAGPPLWERFAWLGVYVVVMWFLVRRLLAAWLRRSANSRLSPGVFSLLLVGLFLSCAATNWMGVHPLFGAFVFGVVLPKSEWLIHSLRGALEPLTGVLLLPLFFAYTGLRTNLELIGGKSAWAYCGLVIAVAVFGKFAGAALPAHSMGQSWRDSVALGALMNTRGLMELVILNIGLDLGLLHPNLFSILVLMALATTLMTNPVLDWILRTRPAPVSS